MINKLMFLWVWLWNNLNGPWIPTFPSYSFASSPTSSDINTPFFSTNSDKLQIYTCIAVLGVILLNPLDQVVK